MTTEIEISCALCNHKHAVSGIFCCMSTEFSKSYYSSISINVSPATNIYHSSKKNRNVNIFRRLAHKTERQSMESSEKWKQKVLSQAWIWSDTTMIICRSLFLQAVDMMQYVTYLTKKCNETVICTHISLKGILFNKTFKKVKGTLISKQIFAQVVGSLTQ